MTTPTREPKRNEPKNVWWGKPKKAYAAGLKIRVMDFEKYRSIYHMEEKNSHDREEVKVSRTDRKKKQKTRKQGTKKSGGRKCNLCNKTEP